MMEQLKIFAAGVFTTTGVVLIGRLSSAWSLVAGGVLIGVGMGTVAYVHTDCVCD